MTRLPMDTHHRIILENAATMPDIEDDSIDLVVTSPPYPMIQMWDAQFTSMDPAIEAALTADDAETAFELMHTLLDAVWAELQRVVKPGGTVCINVGDAVRTVDGRFRLFANHVRIVTALNALGFTQLPAILWRKTTNSPNKFMGSGMLPPNAYVTLEHEYILIFRRSGKRSYATEAEKQTRRSSAYFWEERNTWFSDVWFDLLGTAQALTNGKTRERSAAFPFEVPYRLINMFSVKGDAVLDPFLGTGTTMLAAMAAARHCMGFEIDPAFLSVIMQRVVDLPDMANRMIEKRLQAHAEFIRNRLNIGKTVANTNRPYNIPVVTRQEEELYLEPVRNIHFVDNNRFKVTYGAKHPPVAVEPQVTTTGIEESRIKAVPKGRQLTLF